MLPHPCLRLVSLLALMYDLPWLDLKENIQTMVELETLNSGIPTRGSTVLNVGIRRAVTAKPYTRYAYRFIWETDISKNDLKCSVARVEVTVFLGREGELWEAAGRLRENPERVNNKDVLRYSRQELQSRNHDALFCPVRNRWETEKLELPEDVLLTYFVLLVTQKHEFWI